jgi:hypothetical protein
MFQSIQSYSICAVRVSSDVVHLARAAHVLRMDNRIARLPLLHSIS